MAAYVNVIYQCKLAMMFMHIVHEALNSNAEDEVRHEFDKSPAPLGPTAYVNIRW